MAPREPDQNSGDTLVETDDDVDTATVRLQLPPVEASVGFAARYQPRVVLGAGGMGYVRLCRDRRIGRDVAVKLMRPDAAQDAALRTRFEREARIQGQLEHPAIVPVYDLAPGDDGTYFTMKRVRGHTLEHVVDELRRGDRVFTVKYTVRKLLSAFSQAALAVAFAHSRGVIHRDLKPANVMLGDFGEVYVLDWGLAKLQAESSELAATETVTNPAAGTDGQTLHGAVMGTPGYMAPEQARGETTAIGAASDVYALGALLFELLALEPLHAGDTTQALLASTLAGPDSRPSARAPQRNVAPELDAICVRALALDLSQRYGSVREMVADVERFLEGDRDLERRRQLSQAHIEQARSASATSSIRGRAEAIRELNRSLALEPSNAIALAELKRLLLTPPVETPPEAREMLDRSIDAERRTTAREGVASFAVWLALVPLLGLAGVRDWNTVIATAMAIAASALLALYLWKRKARVSNAAAFALLGVSSLSIVGLSFFLGPFVLIPGVAAQNTVVFAAHAPRGPLRFATIGVGIATVILPFVLEMAGLFPPSFVFRGGELVLLPRMLNLPAAPTLLLLSIGTVATVIVPCIVVSRLLDQVHAARARTFTHLWHMNQLVPEAATARGANGAR